ncbi:hypothetical protein ILYODFUR_031660 [Ilyodon furcidens]|uniref:Uncharacterized protein n=1 Tax=Ilyodon furcidens TaxID=33524 RepID=A0ABV0VKB2_9TELE
MPEDVMDILYLAQTSNFKTPLRFKVGRAFLPIKVMQVIPILSTLALKSPRNSQMPTLGKFLEILRCQPFQHIIQRLSEDRVIRNALQYIGTDKSYKLPSRYSMPLKGDPLSHKELQQ